MIRAPANLMPDPWAPLQELLEASALASTSQFANGTVVGAGNAAIYLPVTFPADMTLYSMRFMAANGNGNYDIGLYNSAFVLLRSSGAVAMSAAGLRTFTFTTDLRVTSGDLYYMGMSFSDATAQVTRSVTNAAALIGAGAGQQSTAHPLPNPMVPVTMAGTSFPLIAFGVR